MPGGGVRNCRYLPTVAWCSPSWGRRGPLLPRAAPTPPPQLAGPRRRESRARGTGRTARCRHTEPSPGPGRVRGLLRSWSRRALHSPAERSRGEETSGRSAPRGGDPARTYLPPSPRSCATHNKGAPRATCDLVEPKHVTSRSRQPTSAGLARAPGSCSCWGASRGRGGCNVITDQPRRVALVAPLAPPRWERVGRFLEPRCRAGTATGGRVTPGARER